MSMKKFFKLIFNYKIQKDYIWFAHIFALKFDQFSLSIALKMKRHTLCKGEMI